MDKYQSFVQGTGYNYQDMKVRQQGKQAAEEEAFETEREELTDYERAALRLMKQLRDKRATLMGVVMLLSGLVVSSEDAARNADDSPCNADRPDGIA